MYSVKAWIGVPVLCVIMILSHIESDFADKRKILGAVSGAFFRCIL
jgi:hypothetical protein